MIRRLAEDVHQAMRPPICAAGFPRSGTTWLGATLDHARGIRTYHEPFNPGTVPRARIADFRYAGASEEDSEFDTLVRDAFAGRVEGPYVEMRLASRYVRHRWWPGRALVKTVFGVLALERIAALTRARVVVVVRNPMDVAASWHRLDWKVNGHIESLRRQPRLLEDHLGPYEPLLRDDDDWWTTFGTLWGAVHLVLWRLIAAHPEWIHLAFEDLCADPTGTYRALFRDLHLRWTADIERRVRASAETPSSHPYRPTRIASDQVGKWHEALEPDQVARLTEALRGFDLLPTGAPAGDRGVRSAG